jgi:glycosyltransferase involved in cell wall biosynthesis
MAPHRDVAALVELTRRFRELRPAIVHTHNPKPGLYGRLAAKAARVPVVVNTVHGLYAVPTDPLPKRTLVYGLERVAAACSDAELLQNVEDVEVLRRWHVPADRLTVLGNGIDLGRFSIEHRAAARADLRAEWDIPEESVVVGAVGRLVLEKGYAELFDAWARIVADRPDAVLVVIGPDDEDKADSLPADVRASGRRAGVRFVGHRSDVERCYHAMDVYVLASWREGFPRSAMEAAACGLPIVATDIRGCRQVVDDGVTGRLVGVRSPDDLVRAIGDLVDDPDGRRDMGAAAAAKARLEFDQQRVIDTTLETYARLHHG